MYPVQGMLHKPILAPHKPLLKYANYDHVDHIGAKIWLEESHLDSAYRKFAY